MRVEYFQIEEVFLTTSTENENFIRKVGRNDVFSYSHEMRSFQDGQRIEKKRQIGAREYIELFESSRCSLRKILKKTRQCFIHEHNYFIVETFHNVDGQPSILRIESSKEKNDIKIPTFLEVIRECTHDEDYVSAKMALEEYKMPANDRKEVRRVSPDHKKEDKDEKKTAKN